MPPKTAYTSFTNKTVWIYVYYNSSGREAFGVTRKHGRLPDVVQPKIQHAHPLKSCEGVEGVGVWGLRVWGCEDVMGESVRVCEGEKNG